MSPAGTNSPSRPDTQWRDALLVIGAGTILRLLLGARLPLVPDEAYYWVWAQHISIGYFDHPPMIAWLIKLGTMVVGHSALGVRIGSIGAGSVAILATVVIARRIAGDQAALVAAAAMTALPLAAAGLVLATPDAPLLAAFAVSLYGVVRALEHAPGTRESLRWWLFTGWAMGLAFMSKYTSILLPMGTLLAVVGHPQLRRRLLEPGPYLACLVATLMFLPVLLWNSQHGWVSFAFQIDHGLGSSIGDFWRSALRHEGDLLGGQLGLASPILLVMMGIAVVGAARLRGRPTEFMLATVSATAFLFFAYSAVQKHVEPNWPAPAYIGGIALLAIRSWGNRAQRWVRAGVILAGVLTAVIYAHAVTPILPIPPARDPIDKAFGWDALADAAVRASKEPADASVTHRWIAANRYQDAAETAFYGDVEGNTFALNLGDAETSSISGQGFRGARPSAID